MITDVVLIIQGTLIGSELRGEVDPDLARMLVIVAQSVTAARVPPVVPNQITRYHDSFFR